jgi:hypothetical protein
MSLVSFGIVVVHDSLSSCAGPPFPAGPASGPASAARSRACALRRRKLALSAAASRPARASRTAAREGRTRGLEAPSAGPGPIWPGVFWAGSTGSLGGTALVISAVAGSDTFLFPDSGCAWPAASRGTGRPVAARAETRIHTTLSQFCVMCGHTNPCTAPCLVAGSAASQHPRLPASVSPVLLP